MKRLERFLFGDQPSALELLWGREVYVEQIVFGAVRFWVVFVPATLAGVALAGTDVPGYNASWVVVLTLLSSALILVGSAVVRRLTQNGVYRYIAAACPIIGFAVWATGPLVAETAALLPVFAALFTLIYATRAAISLMAISLGSYAVALAAVDGFIRPGSRFLFVGGICVATMVVMQWVVSQIRVLSDNERAVSLQLEVMNHELEERVTDQVDEIERLGRLRRFLSSQVADTVMSTGGEEMLSTHRRQIACVFVDLRGFTSFSGVAEPEDVIDVLTEFYAAVGKIVKRLEATVGGFQGDGVMAYFNDPFPCEDPAGRALDMAISLHDPLTLLRERWLTRGFEIGFGVGVAYGYATLGTIGFEERSDYTPLGSVVNLASRLCDEAKHGEALLDARSYEAVQDRVEATRCNLDLKGFSGVVTAYRLALSG